MSRTIFRNRLSSVLMWSAERCIFGVLQNYAERFQTGAKDFHLKLRKIERPAGEFTFDVQPLVEDNFGMWFYARRGSRWEAPHSIGRLPYDCVLLLSPGRFWVAVWVYDPADRRLEIVVCLASELEHDGW